MQSIWLVPVAAAVAVIYIVWLAYDVLSRDTGTENMEDVGDMIYEGAVAFLTRQYSTIAVLAVVTAVIITVLIAVFEQHSETAFTGWALGYAHGYRLPGGCGCLSAVGCSRHVRGREV